MAVQVIASVNAFVVNPVGGLPTDVGDTQTALTGTVDVFVPPQAGTSGQLTIEPVAASLMQALITAFGALPAGSTGLPCTITLSVGAGSATINPTQ